MSERTTYRLVVIRDGGRRETVYTCVDEDTAVFIRKILSGDSRATHLVIESEGSRNDNSNRKQVS
jgi:hypothetical protein